MRRNLFCEAGFEFFLFFLFRIQTHDDSHSSRSWAPAPSVISGYLCGTLLIIRASARISLGYAACRAVVCCHDNPFICNVGISRLRLFACLPCQGLGLARWIVISEAIFWQRLHFTCAPRLKGQSCATSIYCVWTLNPWGALYISPCLSPWHTNTYAISHSHFSACFRR